MNSITIIIIQILLILHRTHSYKNYDTKNNLIVNHNGEIEIEMDYDYESRLKSKNRHSKHNRKKCRNGAGILTLVYEEDYDTGSDSDECNCDCTQCADIKPSCNEECTNCDPTEQNSPTDPYPISSQTGVIYIPYYPTGPGLGIGMGMGMGMPMGPPFFIPPMDGQTNVTTNETLTAASRRMESQPEVPPKQEQLSPQTISKPPVDFKQERADPSKEIGDTYLGERNDKSKHEKYIITSFRPTKPYWLPKYGIVPLPDHLAERLMSKMKNSQLLRKLKKE